jgi:hypothetical protein
MASPAMNHEDAKGTNNPVVWFRVLRAFVVEGAE